MRSEFQLYDFPKQRIPDAEKTPEFFAKCTDWVIAQGMRYREDSETDLRYDILNGNIPTDAYRKVLNPYNSTNEKYTRFPATMRHHEMIKGVIRRYVGEYIKSPHDFIVGANNPEIVLAKNNKLKEELAAIVEQKIAAKIQETYAQWVNGGQDPKQFDPKTAIDIEAFIKEFNENYIDDISEQGQDILNVIRDITEDPLIYARAYFDFVSFGECYTYTEIVGKELIKKNISVLDAYPIPTDNIFVEDDDMFAYKRKLSFQQISDEFDAGFSTKDRDFLETYYATGSANITSEYAISVYDSYFPEISGKFNKSDRDLLKNGATMSRDTNTGLYDVWHCFWRGYVRQSLVTFTNENSLVDTRIEKDDYILNPEIGDIDIDYVYQPQVFESVRIGGRNDAIYPYGGRAIAFNRNGKLPVNGLTELMPGLGKFSIVGIVYPYSVFYDIVFYHREMALARNKLSILMIAKSLLGVNSEETIYKMVADGVLYIDDQEDHGMIRAQQVRMLQASNTEYISQLGVLLQEIEQTANMKVDMTPQRYGEIANSAGKGTTDEAIARGSMGSIVIEFMMDYMRERDYARDMDFSKFAWIDGLDTSYTDIEGKTRYVSLDVDKHNYASYLIKGKNSTKEKEKLAQYKQLAFSAAQNGDILMATAAIDGDNVASVSKLIKKYHDQKDAQDEKLKQLELQTEQLRQDLELRKIAAKGDEDRKTKELEGYLDQQIQLIKADANLVSFDNGVPTDDKEAAIGRLESSRISVEHEKVNAIKNNAVIDSYNKFQDRKLKDKDIKTKLEIAKINRNRFDFKAKK